jgi:competence protein ComEC
MVSVDAGTFLDSAAGSLFSFEMGGAPMPHVCVFLIIFLLGSSLSIETQRWLIVWNVGQGQFVTMTDERGCWHFDIGGEFAPWTAVMSECRGRRNFVSLSHWDWDHVGMVGTAARFLPNACLLLPPPGENGKSPRKMRQLKNLRACHETAPFSSWTGSLHSSTNASSRVVYWQQVLVPGDSPIDQEKLWIHSFKNLERARILILGHHGSQTSTGKDLLKALTSVRLAIASSRHRRYGHPHMKTQNALRARAIPLLTTEEWGTIRVEL